MRMAETQKAYLALGQAVGETQMAVKLLDCNRQNGTSMVDDYQVLWQLGQDLVALLEPHRIPS